MTRNNPPSIITGLRELLNSTSTEYRDVKVGSHTETREIYVRPCGGEDRSWIDEESFEVDDYENQAFQVPNTEERLRAL